MDDALKEWLWDGPFTHLQTRIRHFVNFCVTLVPLSHRTMRKHVLLRVHELMKGELGRRWTRDRNVRRVIRVYGQDDQRTAAWHSKRGQMITASELGAIFTGGETRRSVMVRKLEPPAPSTGPPCAPLIWGTRFEPVAKKIYEEETSCSITDVSCVQHPIHSFLGASPDGIVFPTNEESRSTRYGRLVEFKCPFSRVAKDGVPSAYIHQMQMQMECAGIDECEYVEFRFKQVFYAEWVAFQGRKGIFAIFEDDTVSYIKDASWGNEHQKVHWILQSVKKDFVPKDPEWLPKHFADMKSFWDEVVQHRAAGTKPASPPSTTVTIDL
uniref:YqaJ viral recombinase domain-containing protein n=1 Tax=viral metagenome TaxID=1070528 RepID=A0A6C0JFU2_9ZZZZ